MLPLKSAGRVLTDSCAAAYYTISDAVLFQKVMADNELLPELNSEIECEVRVAKLRVVQFLLFTVTIHFTHSRKTLRLFCSCLCGNSTEEQKNRAFLSSYYMVLTFKFKTEFFLLLIFILLLSFSFLREVLTI